MKKIVFVDRDGTLLIEPPETQQINGLAQMEFVPETISALKRLAEAGYEFVMVTNQDGLGTPANPRDNYDLINQKLFEILGSEGVTFLAVFADTSTPDNPSPARKPETGLVDQFIKETAIDFENSLMIGDRETDMQFAENIGVRGFLLGDRGWAGIAEEIIKAPRRASISRKTKETDIVLSLNIDGSGKTEVDTGLKFYDHMLEQLGRHGSFDLDISCKGDLEIDEHHTIEDVAIALGDAFRKALGDKRGIERYASEKIIVMDEARCEIAIDLSGRAYLVFSGECTREYVGDFPTEMLKHVFYSLTQQIGMSVHISLSGQNTHHMLEVAFKGLSRTLKDAVVRTSTGIPSTKGIL